MKPPAFHRGYFVAWRTDDFLELLRAKPNAFRLLTLIAYRARYRDGYNGDGVGPDECLIGADDVARALDLSTREYRTAKDVLESAGFATFAATGRGTVARLMDSRVFASSVPDCDRPSDSPGDEPPTDQRQTSDRLTTTNKKEKKEKKDKNDGVFEIPLELQGEEFNTAWTLWQQHRVEMRKKKLTASSAKLQLDQLAGWGTARAVAAIRHSVANGWLSIHEPNESRAAAGPGTAEIEARIKELNHEIPMRAGTPEADGMIKERDGLKAKLAAAKGGPRE